MYDIKALYEATSVPHAIELLLAHPEAKIIAGGSDVLVQMREGRLAGRRMGGQWFIDHAAVEAFTSGNKKEDRFTRDLRSAARTKPLDSVIGIGAGPGSDIVNGLSSYRADSLHRQ